MKGHVIDRDGVRALIQQRGVSVVQGLVKVGERNRAASTVTNDVSAR